MQVHALVGVILVAGLVVFLIGAGGWKLVDDQPMREALPVIHTDRRRRAWIHLWMIPAMFLTSAGMFGLAAVVGEGVAATLSLMAGVVYALGAVCWIVSLAFRLTVVPLAAEQTVERGEMPEGFAALDSWAGWVGIVGGILFAAGFLATRREGPFNPPFWAHPYTAMIGILLLS